MSPNAAMPRAQGLTAPAIVLLHPLFVLLVLVYAMASRPAAAAEPALEIAINGHMQSMTRDALLRHSALRTIDIPADVAYHRPMHYRAVPLAVLTGPLRDSDIVQFTALDGFVANIPAAVLAGPGQPFVAVEPQDAPWPAVKPGGPSAGPFYLVWLTPGKGGVSQEQWPYQIAKISTAAPLAQRHPQILPNVQATSAARRGMDVYVANCAVCHTLNGGGDAAVGPDLNRPFSPTEYFSEPFLRKLVRDPASVRDWKQRVMPGFPKEALSDAQLDDLLAYLRQMAAQR